MRIVKIKSWHDLLKDGMVNYDEETIRSGSTEPNFNFKMSDSCSKTIELTAEGANIDGWYFSDWMIDKEYPREDFPEYYL